jgi:hypothetical protein
MLSRKVFTAKAINNPVKVEMSEIIKLNVWLLFLRQGLSLLKLSKKRLIAIKMSDIIT